MPFLSTFPLPPLQLEEKNFAVYLKRKDGLSWRHWEAIQLDSDINAVPELKKISAWKAIDIP